MRKFLSLLLALVMVLCCIPAVAETADGVYEGTGAGLNGQIKVSVTVSGGKITEVKVLEHSETAGISDPAIEKIPAAIVEAQSADVDIVSGATFTSKGIIEAVKNALNPDEAKEATMPFEQPDILVIGAGMAGLATAARAAELGLNVLVVDRLRPTAALRTLRAARCWAPARGCRRKPVSRTTPICASRTLCVWAALATSTRKLPANSLKSAAKRWTGWTIWAPISATASPTSACISR